MVATLTYDPVQQLAHVQMFNDDQRDGGPTFGDFVTILAEGSLQDITVARLQSTKLQTPLPPPLNVMCCVRVSLRTVISKYI
jgi:hypothetical protein